MKHGGENFRFASWIICGMGLVGSMRGGITSEGCRRVLVIFQMSGTDWMFAFLMY